MTVSYAAEVAQCKKFGSFPKLLFRWRASIYKLIWLDLMAYLAAYYGLTIVYRFCLNEEHKQITLIPLTFVLGFYVSIVVKRWWEQYTTMPWPDSTAVYISSLLRGQDDNGRKMRRTIMRYVCLTLTMVLTMISPGVKKRFPTLDHLVDMGLLVENEKNVLTSMNEKFANYPKHWMPIVWASSIVTRARKEGRIRDDSSVKTLIDSLNTFRGNCMALTFYDTISIPLVYTQVVTIAVYSYFLASLIGRQWTVKANVEGKMNIVDYFPIFLVLEFLFFMGWLKVAESLICPFGEDDDDFELNWMIDRNIQVSYLIVDEMHNEHPDLLKDQFWHGKFPPVLMYSSELSRQEGPPQHSTARMDEPQARRTFFSVPIIESITHLFFRTGGRQSNQSPRDTEHLDKIDSGIQQFIDNQTTGSCVVTEVRSDNLKSSGICRKLSKTVQIKSEISMENLKKAENRDNGDTDEFEQLKQQRLQEKAERQNYVFAVPTSVDNETDTDILETVKSSLASMGISSSETDTVKEEENKKDK